MELAPGVSIIHDLILPDYRREDMVLYVDTLGGLGRRMDEQHDVFEQTNVAGTICFTFTTEAAARAAEKAVKQWVEKRILVTVESGPDGVILTDPMSGVHISNVR